MRVLLAEDNPSLAATIADGLREEGYVVEATGDGTDALHKAQAGAYDGIILDLSLPGTDGFDILASLRRVHVSTPILCLTARDQIADRVRGLDLGADDYLVKPFAYEELRAMIRRGHVPRSGVIQIGDLEVDTAQRIARRGGKTIHFSAREYKLLECLATHQDQVVSRGKIWDHVYEEGEEAASNVVDVYVGYLRSKIDKGFSTKLIHTKRGVGYMLSAKAGPAPAEGADASDGTSDDAGTAST